MSSLFSNLSWHWIIREKLRKKPLESKLKCLAAKEKEFWIPVYYKAEKNKKDICAQERLEMAEWVNRSCLKCGWDIETRFCALSLMDDVMRRVRVNARLKLPVAAATTCIAAKLNDEQEQQGMKPAPYIIHKANLNLSAKEINRMELLLLQKLNWHPRPSIALSVLQTMMALVTISSPLLQEDSFNRESFLMLHLEIQLRLLFLLMMQAESTEFRPSVLALSVVFFHMDWSGDRELKNQLLPLFQKLLKVSDRELEECLNFCYPVIGYYFYDHIPEFCRCENEEIFDEIHQKNLGTLYDRLILDLRYSSEIYSDMRTHVNRSSDLIESEAIYKLEIKDSCGEDAKKRKNSTQTLQAKSSCKRNRSKRKKKKGAKHGKEMGKTLV